MQIVKKQKALEPKTSKKTNSPTAEKKVFSIENSLRGEAFTLLRQFLTYRAATITLDKIVARVIVAAR